MKLPRAYDGSVFLMDYERGWIQRVTVDDQGASKVDGALAPRPALERAHQHAHLRRAG